MKGKQEMSTKIYDGKKLPNMSVFELNEFYKSLRAELIPIAQQEYYKLVTKIAQIIYVYVQTGDNIDEYNIDFRKIDEAKKSKPSFGPITILILAREYADEMIKKTSDAVLWADAEPDADFDVSLCLLPIATKLLCLPYSNNSKLFKALTNRPEFEEYGYWNNTDRPERLSEEEWEHRRKDWDEALPGIGVPRENGIVVKLIDPTIDIRHHIGHVSTSIIPYLEDAEKLRMRVAKHRIFMREFESAVAAIEKLAASDSYKFFRQATDYVEAHPEEVKELADSFAEILNAKEFFENTNTKNVG